MKNLILALMVLASAPIALAGQSALQCREAGAGLDNGLSVQVSRDLKTAIIAQITDLGESTIATLQCWKTQDPRGSTPDMPYTALTCYDPHVRDGGYAVDIREGGFTGLTTAVVSEVTVRDATPIAQLSCDGAEQ